jgi:hypothetical protein
MWEQLSGGKSFAEYLDDFPANFLNPALVTTRVNQLQYLVVTEAACYKILPSVDTVSGTRVSRMS